MGSARAFHERPLPEPPRRAVWRFAVERPALVLGSTQLEAAVDRRAAARAEVEVVRRRSGGGAVLLVPGEALWVDVIVPSADPRSDDDVGRAVHWLGETWMDGLAAVGIAGTVHRGPMRRTRWSSSVCFAGVGPGEVLDRDGRKLVGISQRRSRAGARFQCVALSVWDPAAVVGLLALADDERAVAAAELVTAAATIEPSALDALFSAFVAALATR